MTDNIVQLKRTCPSENIAKTLRLIADEVERGDFGVITTAALCLGHTESKLDGEVIHRDTYELFGIGPRVDMFTIRGLLLTCATKV